MAGTKALANVKVPPKDEEELLLEKLVFGDSEGFESNLKKIDNLYDFSDDEDNDNASSLSDSDEEGSDLDGVQDEDLFFIDDNGDNGEDAMEIDEDEQSNDSESDEDDNEDGDAWIDSDDEKVTISLLSSDRIRKLRKTESDSIISGNTYSKRIRSQFEKIYPRPEWITKLEEKLQAGDDEEDDNEDLEEVDENSGPEPTDSNAILSLLSTSASFIITKQLKLIAPNRISITRLQNANHVKPSKGAIQTLSFHHSHPLLMTGGFDRTLRIYHIDGKTNNLVTSLHLRNSPITSLSFSPLSANSNLIFAGGRRRYMNKWDLNSGEVEKISRMYGHEQTQKSFEYFKISPKGNYIGLTGNSGWCNILNGVTGQWIRGFKIEGTIIDFEFGYDESFIIIVNTAGEVWEFELNSKSKTKKVDNGVIINKWQDDAGVGITKIKLGGPKNRWLAIGTNNGIVNIYDRNSNNLKPFKCVENLVTSISSLAFSPDGQILAIASRAKKDAFRLVHLPSGTVYSNWPTSGTPLGRVTAVSFSPNNEMLAIGNEGGKVTLWRLNHY